MWCHAWRAWARFRACHVRRQSRPRPAPGQRGPRAARQGRRVCPRKPGRRVRAGGWLRPHAGLSGSRLGSRLSRCLRTRVPRPGWPRPRCSRPGWPRPRACALRCLRPPGFPRRLRPRSFRPPWLLPRSCRPRPLRPPGFPRWLRSRRGIRVACRGRRIHARVIVGQADTRDRIGQDIRDDRDGLGVGQAGQKRGRDPGKRERAACVGSARYQACTARTVVPVSLPCGILAAGIRARVLGEWSRAPVIGGGWGWHAIKIQAPLSSAHKQPGCAHMHRVSHRPERVRALVRAARALVRAGRPWTRAGRPWTREGPRHGQSESAPRPERVSARPACSPVGPRSTPSRREARSRKPPSHARGRLRDQQNVRPSQYLRTNIENLLDIGTNLGSNRWTSVG
jgi:hypothetical protein